MPVLEICLAATMHFLPGDWNNVHPCVNIKHEQFSIGAYYNSESRTSLYASYSFGQGPLTFEIGAATGYSSVKVVPFARLNYSINDRLTLFAAPAYDVGTEEFGALIGIETKLLRLGRK